MIYCLTGTLLEKSLDNVVIDVQGVGFSLAVPSTVQGVLPAVGEKCTLYTYLSVKEDALDLYGFADKAEQKAFKTLISVSGVGPKAGLAILSVLSPQKIALAVTTGDYKSFTAANGVGPKVAQRIVLELKGKFSNDDVAGGVTMADVQRTAVSTGSVSQAISALIALGYNQSQAALAVSKLDAEQDVQSLIKQALKLLAGGKI
ncbi:MAG: Holliday junction branch migration protein RuvA [Oscillospiraceae bacterium]|jgi:Holliday junction DNA helicase RuvA|nr:Holliday junction branch migration protein RuvA [Oscillospiraceae bacterium]